MKLTAINMHYLEKLAGYGSEGWRPLGVKIFHCKKLASLGYAQKQDRQFFITEAGRTALQERGRDG